MDKPYIRIRIEPRRPEFDTAEIVDQRKNRCRIGGYVGLDHDARMPGQGQPNKNEHDDQCGDCVKDLSHSGIV